MLDSPLVLADPSAPPPSYHASPYFDQGRGFRELRKIAKRHGDAWPQLPAIVDLVSVGLYDLSGPLLAEVYEDYKVSRRSSRYKRYTAARAIPHQHDLWRPLFYAARDHNHTDRFTYGLWEDQPDPELARQAITLGYPLAHDRHVWNAARANDIDPFLVLGLMRTESRYDALAESRVGARGAMQIMPRTGHLMANLRDDEHFLAGDLEDPVFAVEMGIDYLGLLMRRFDGCFPLAVASYNGGPHNVGAWLQGTGSDMPIDAFVEHIPFRETRRYVRTVSSHYDVYVDLYADPMARVALPTDPYADDPLVVDF